MLLLRGVAQVMTGGTDVGFQGKFPGFRFIAEGSALGMPMPFWFAAAAIGLTAFLMHRTRFGRHCYAIGANAQAAGLSGVPVANVRLIVFLAAALLSGGAGVLYVAYHPTTTPSLGESFELTPSRPPCSAAARCRAAVALCSAWSSAPGILQLSFNAVNLVGKSLWQNVVAGGVILLAAVVDRVFEMYGDVPWARRTPTVTT